MNDKGEDFESYETKTNRITNEEQMKNNVEVDYGCNLVVPRPRFSLISSSSL